MLLYQDSELETTSKRPTQFAKAKSLLWGSQLRRNMSSGMLLSLVAAGVMATSYTTYLHILGYEQYGLWIILSTVVSFSQVGNLGIAQAIAKHVAEEYSRGNVNGVREYVTSGSIIVAAAGALILSLVLLFQHQLIAVGHLSPANSATALTLLPGVALLTIYIFFVDISNNILNGLGRFDLCNACQVLAQVVALCVSATLLMLNLGVIALLIGNIVGYGSSHLVSYVLVRRILGQKAFAFSAWRPECARRLLTFGGWLFGSSVTFMLLAPLNRLALARFGGLAAVPVFDISFNGSMRIRNLIEASQRSLTAEVSKLAAITSKANWNRIHSLASKGQKLLWSSAPLFLGLMIIATPALRLWLGSRYVPALTTTFRLMLAGAFISLLSTPAYYVLLGLGRAKHIFLANVLQSGTNIIILIILISVTRRLSATDVVLAASVGMITASFYLSWQGHRPKQCVA